MKAIMTKYLPVTNTKPARIKAYTVDNNSIVITAGRYENDYQDHKSVAWALIDKMGWNTDGKLNIIGGGTYSGS